MQTNSTTDRALAAAPAAAPAVAPRAPAAAPAAAEATAAAAGAPDPAKSTRRTATLIAAASASASARTAPLPVAYAMIKVNASVLKSIQGFGDMDDMLFKDKWVRRMAPGQVDINQGDASDKIAVVDIIIAVVGMSQDSARQWMNNNKNMNKYIAPSLAYVKGAKVRLLNLFKYN